MLQDALVERQDALDWSAADSLHIDRTRRETTMKLLVLFHSTYGHVYRLAQPVAEGAAPQPAYS
jgi:hypothetical protein